MHADATFDTLSLGHRAVEAPPAKRTLVFRLPGTGCQYFRIRVITLLLSLATFGIYSAWAKMRRLQYFDPDTTLPAPASIFTRRIR